MEIHVSRIETLFNRRERLIEANHKYDYVHNKIDQYTSVLLALRKEIAKTHKENKNHNANHPLMRFLEISKGLNGREILTLINKTHEHK